MNEEFDSQIVQEDLPDVCRVGIEKKKAKRLSVWMRIWGVLQIISAIGNVFSLFTIPIGVLSILGGIKIFNAGGHVASLCRGVQPSANYSAENIAEGFKFQGIALIISLIIGIISLLISLSMVSLIIAGVSSIVA